jgi:hypothetical protein
MDRGLEGSLELHAHRRPSCEEMHAVFGMCRQNQWTSVLNCVRSNPWISVTSMIMDNHISTTILHQAITSKGDTKARARVIREILASAPNAAAIKNGYGSLPCDCPAQHQNGRGHQGTSHQRASRGVQGCLGRRGWRGETHSASHYFYRYVTVANCNARSILRSEDTWNKVLTVSRCRVASLCA